MGGEARERRPITSARSEDSKPAGNARDELVQSHLPLARAMARRYGGRGEDFDDLVQIGALGLVKASGRFDPARGVAFASFAAPAVEGEIRRHLRERGPGVRLPRETQRMTTELKRCQAELAAALGRDPTVPELAVALDADEAEVERLIVADLARDPVALSDGDAGGELAAALESTAESETRVLLAEGLRALDGRERRIVFLRFHADMTERQIARTVGLSQAHISRLLDGALAKLRTALASPVEAKERGDSTESAVISPAAPVGHGAKPSDDTAPEQPPAPGRRSRRTRRATGYSGRVLVRMPSELHEQLTQAAEREDVSLNRYVTQALSSSLDPGEPATQARPRALRAALVTNLAVVILAGVVAVVLLVLALERGI
jgi:RNA polymerase sigma-B factor